MRHAVLSLLLLVVGCHAASPQAPAGVQRLVSLSPSITETLFELGAGDRVVGVTDFCDFPPEVKQRTRTGSILQPNYEVIARLQPTLILGEQIHSSPTDRLTAIAPTTILPWLTLDDITTSIRTLGRIVDRSANAEALATRLKTRLSRPAPAKAPRVLLVIGGEPGPLSEIWYVKRDTLHGRVLEAAGGRNAIDKDEPGSPVLSLERVIAVNPDIVLLLISTEGLSDDVKQRYVDAWKTLPIKAVRDRAVQVISGSEVQSTGPRILSMEERLAATIRILELEGSP